MRILHVLTVFVVLTLAACGSFDEATSSVEQGAIEDSVPGGVNLLVSDEDTRAFSNILAIQQRKVISTASLALIVTNPAEEVDRVGQLAQELEGWVVSSSVNKASGGSGDERIFAAITIRVPAESFREALERIKSGVVSIEAESVSGQDVTQEYVDLQSQLSNLEAAEGQLQTIMDSASTIDSVLEVHNELVRVRGEIEIIKGRVRYYDEAAAYSSISVDLRSETTEDEQGGEPWSPQDTISSALDALVAILQALADVVIVLVIIGAPLFLLVVLPAWYILRFAERRGWTQRISQKSQADTEGREG